MYDVGLVSQIILLEKVLCTPTKIKVTIHIKTVNAVLINILRYGMVVNTFLLETMRFATYRDK